MTKISKITSFLLSCGVAFAMVSTASAQTVQGNATVVRIKGSARYSQAGEWKPLRAGDVLPAGTIIQTGLDKGSYVDLVLSDANSGPVPAVVNAGHPSTAANVVNVSATASQNIVRLTENTALGVDQLSSQNTGTDLVTDTQLDLKQGRIIGSVKKLSPGSKYEIKIPNGVAGIRGTLFELSANGNLKVSVGSVVLAHAGPDGNIVTQVVNGNEQYNPNTGQLIPLGAGGREAIAEVASQVAAGTRASTSSAISMDQTIRRVSPHKKGKGQGPGPFGPGGPFGE